VIEQLKENEKLKDKINRELEQMVEERTREISMQKEEIEAQRDELAGKRDLLESQKKEITDSINYAKKIQTAVLPSDEMLREMLPEHFVLFRPRDIVSGDFYWARQIKNFTVVVAADSTGHGVPGAFMSMLGMSFLNELVSRSRFDTAGEILDRLRKKVKTTLRQEGPHEQQKDGMDVALVVIDHDSMEVQYAGAFNPLYLVRENAKDVVSLPKEKITTETDTHALHEFKADRQPISVYFNESKFRTLRFTVKPGDTLYIFSDGYIDQMGGPMGKKFKARRFKDLILGMQEEAMESQKEILEKTLNEWKEDTEQVDDILVIGIRI
jgi:serine phosphatase RsbU (regulator of sigma subunit)